jgi:hypothetical protein
MRLDLWLIILILAAAMLAVHFVHAATLVCHQVQDIRYCDGPGAYRSEEHVTGGITYGRDSEGKHWTGHNTGGQEYWQTWHDVPHR